MKERRYGKIINIFSVGVIHPLAHAIRYNADKARVSGFTYDLALPLVPFNTCVNAILPGPAQEAFYDLTIGSMIDKMKDAFFEELARKNVQPQREGAPADVVGGALFPA